MALKSSLRILNKKSSIMGLSVEDLLLVAGFHFFTSALCGLLRLDLDLYVLMISVICLMVLSMVRLRYRRHILRDGSIYLWVCLMRGGVAYDPSSYRIRK
jgi:hypothetical protein